jgi:hypothetical protein
MITDTTLYIWIRADVHRCILYTIFFYILLHFRVYGGRQSVSQHLSSIYTCTFAVHKKAPENNNKML